MGVYYRLINSTKQQFIDPDELSLDGSWNSIKFPGYMYGCGSLVLSWLLSNKGLIDSWIGDHVEWVPDTTDTYFCEQDGYENIGKQIVSDLAKAGIDIKYEES